MQQLWSAAGLARGGGYFLLPSSPGLLAAALGVLALLLALAWGAAMLAAMRAGRRAVERADVFRRALEQASDLVVIADSRGTIEYVNQAVERATGRRREEIVGRAVGSWFPAEDRKVLRESWEAARAGRPYRALAPVRKADGDVIQADISASPVPEEGGPGRVILSVRDATRERELQTHLDHLIRHDGLTGLPNRIAFVELLEAAIAGAAPGEAVAVTVLVVDRFKHLNSVFGREAGEEVLRWVAGKLRASVGSDGVVARLGSAEFGVLGAPGAGAEAAGDLEELAHQVSRDPELPITVSAGIAVWPRDGEDARELLRSADLALTRAKSAGRNSARSFSGDLDAQVSETVLMETRLFRALANREYQVAYQPYFDLESSSLTGGEALIRWRNAELGAIAPAKFIPSLEETGMIVEVGDWVLRTACRQLRDWRGPTPAFSLSVNLSPGQMHDRGLVRRVSEAIQEYQVDPRRLTLEVTESTLMQDVEFARAVLTRLRDLGVSIAVDDFGTGYSSLAYLKKLPLNYVKIDGSFVRDVARDPDTASIVTAITGVARSLDLKTIAEGVETQEQVNVLRLLRCDMGQGFHYSPPVSASDFAAYLTRWHFSRKASISRIP